VIRAALVALLILAAFLAGLALGPLRTGQVAPLDWLAPGSAALALAAWLAGRRHDPATMRADAMRVVAAGALPAMLLLLARAAAGPLPVSALVALASCGALAAALGRLAATRDARRQGPALLLLGAATLAAYGAARPPPRAPRPAPLLVMAGPAIHEPHGEPATGFAEAPLWRWLAEGGRVAAIDAIRPADWPTGARLLLIQPRALAPAELMALDKWVRRGGRAVILADPLLLWADPRPLGDPRRAPVTSLLDPLLTHWGVALPPVDPRGPAVDRVWIDAAKGPVQFAGATRFRVANPRCLGEAGGRILRCRIGMGAAVLVADADWINDALWTRAPARPADSAAWTSAAPALLASVTGDPMPPPLAWVRRPEALVAGVRGALLVWLGVAGLLLLLGWLQSRTDRDQGRTKME
jgi:hypothetical protein